MDKKIQTLMENLKRNGMEPFYVETKEDVVPLIKTLVVQNATVSNGGSKTLEACGVMEHLRSGRYTFFDRTGLEGDEIRQCYINAFGCDAYFTSSNAVTMDGVLYNVDGNSNRVACIVYGPKSVIMVVGKNKIVKDMDEAVLRIKTIAAPKNTQRLSCKTPCAVTGECVSLQKDNPQVCDGCASQARICCNYVVTAQQRHVGRIKVILVNEELGY